MNRYRHSGLIIDSKIRFENFEEQPKLVNEENNIYYIYIKIINLYSKKFKILNF